MPHEQIASFSSIEGSTREDWALIATDFMKYAQQGPQRIAFQAKLLDGGSGGFPPGRLAAPGTTWPAPFSTILAPRSAPSTILTLPPPSPNPLCREKIIGCCR